MRSEIGTPDPPNLTSPQNGAPNVDPLPQLWWELVTGCIMYHIQIAKDFGFTEKKDSAFVTENYKSGFSELSEMTQYFWRVRAILSNDTTCWSSIWNFTIGLGSPEVLLPLNGASNISLQPTFHWNHSDYATTYRLQVSSDSVFSPTHIIVESSSNDTSYTLSGLLSTSTDYFWRVRELALTDTGSWSWVRRFTTQSGIIHHSIRLPQGWNMNSSLVAPRDSTLDTVFVKIKSHLIIAKNGAGQVYWPVFSINTIGKWKWWHGYQIYMNVTDTLTIEGNEVEPYTHPIALIQGWNLSAYLRNKPMRCDSAINSIASTLVLLKNNEGQTYWPEYYPNIFIDMKPGQGYQIYLSSAATLTYPPNQSPAPLQLLSKTHSLTSNVFEYPKPKHYKSDNLNTGVNATLLIEAPGLKDEDEIAVWDKGKRLVGSGIIKAGKAVITIWGQNEITKDKVEGPLKGEILNLTCWTQKDGKEKSIELNPLNDVLTKKKIDNVLRYEKDGVWTVRLSDQGSNQNQEALLENYPNPFNPTTMIRFAVPTDGKVTLRIFDILGRVVMTLLDEPRVAGFHQVQLDASHLPSGMYVIHLKTKETNLSKKIILTK
ncbi:MAG: T9SS type A sorting domain-containing protein [bacterium]